MGNLPMKARGGRAAHVVSAAARSSDGLANAAGNDRGKPRRKHVLRKAEELGDFGVELLPCRGKLAMRGCGEHNELLVVAQGLRVVEISFFGRLFSDNGCKALVPIRRRQGVYDSEVDDHWLVLRAQLKPQVRASAERACPRGARLSMMSGVCVRERFATLAALVR
jgi:hypothetical protein